MNAPARDWELLYAGRPAAHPALSILLPCYRKAEYLRHALGHNAAYLQRPEIEVVVMVDHPGEHEQVCGVVREYPAINWKVFGITEEHEWRNPAPVLNAGVLRASASQLLVASPESVFIGDVPKKFMLRNQGRSAPARGVSRAFCGAVKFLHLGESLDVPRPRLPYGSIYFARTDWMRVGGYPERRTGWGCEDDIFRKRLVDSGVNLVFCPEVLLAHFESAADLELREQRDFRAVHQRPMYSFLHLDSGGE